MTVSIVFPAKAAPRSGNRITAARWARILRGLGCRVRVTSGYEPADLMIALHARKSAAAALRFRREHPERPLVVALTGTDVYRDVGHSDRARRALRAATRLVVLQPLAREELAPSLRAKTRVVFQSAKPVHRASRRRRTFDVCVLGHLRLEKDPFRAAIAARHLPDDVRVLHLGAALSPAMVSRARAEERRNPRYRWLGDRPHAIARRILARSRLLVLSSRMEGGANAISEALAAGVPILSSRIPGSVGLLGEGYPGYFPVGDTAALARLLGRAREDPAVLTRLARACARRAWITAPERESRSWERLLSELGRSAAISRRRDRR